MTAKETLKYFNEARAIKKRDPMRMETAQIKLLKPLLDTRN
jgi:hypothetical protein